MHVSCELHTGTGLKVRRRSLFESQRKDLACAIVTDRVLHFGSLALEVVMHDYGHLASDRPRPTGRPILRERVLADAVRLLRTNDGSAA